MSILHSFLVSSQLWKLYGNILRNADPFMFWTSDDVWKFKTKDDLIYIENISKAKVLGATNNSKVILETLKENKAGQLWKKGISDANNGYYTIENSEVPKVLTASFLGDLEIKGKLTLRQIPSYVPN